MDSESLEEIKVISLSSTQILCVKWSHDDRRIASAGSDGVIRIYQTQSFILTALLQTRNRTPMPITSLTWRNPTTTDQLNLLSCSSDGWISYWKTEIQKLDHQFLLQGKHAIICEYSISGNLFAVGCRDFSIQIFSADSYELRYILFEYRGDNIGHLNHVFALKWISERLLVSGGWDKLVLVWDVESREVLKVFNQALISGQSLDFKNGKLLIGSYDRSQKVKVINIYQENGNQVQNSYIREIYSAQYSKVSDVYITVGTQICLWNGEDNSLIAKIEEQGKFLSCDWAYSQNLLVVSSAEGKITLYSYQLNIKSIKK